VRHITDTLYKLDGAGYLPKERWHIWTVEVRNGKGTQLTTGGIHHELGPSYSPDGSHITFISNRAEKPDLEPGKDDLFVMPSAGGEAARIPTPEGAKMSPVYSPDGKWIAYIGMDGRGEYWRNLDLWIVPADGSAPARDLTGNDDLHVMSFTSTDCGDGLMMPPTWSPDSRKIYFQVTRHGDTALMSLSIEDAAPAAAREIDTGGILGPYSFDESGERLAYVINTPGNPSRLYIRDGQKGRSRRLTRLNDGWLSRVDLGQLEEVWFEARDGHKLHGWILKPPGFDPAKKYPSIMQIHGGPHVQYGRGFMHEFYFLSGQGYVVYFSNPRGGQGYGEMHCKAIWNDWGTVDYDDVMDWAEFINAKPYIDSDRRGVTGGSYGGYMTNLIIGRTDQFKAAVTQRSVSNMLSMWGSSDGNWRFQMSYGDDMPPFDHVEKYWGASPMKYIGNAKTPTLVIHSEQDLRAAQEQGEQIYVALRKLGVDSELLLFPDEPHGLSRVGRTDRRVTRLTHMVRWFDKYLK
jgi:dipeptidyl aminopeptidase/acylaminoacyl peptidase